MPLACASLSSKEVDYFLPIPIYTSDVQCSALPAFSAVQTRLRFPHSFICKGSTAVHKKVLPFISLNKTLTVSDFFLPRFREKTTAEKSLGLCYKASVYMMV